MSRTARAALLATVLATLMALPVAAQTTTGTVVGSVKDAQGGVIPGATVALTSETRGTKVPSVVTGTTGDFTFVNIAPDSYQLQITMSGFKALIRKGVTVTPGDRIVLPSMTIDVGGTNETVTVTAESALIQAQSGERSFNLGTDAVQNLPIASRSFTELARLAPGVTVDANQTPTRIGGGGSTNIMMDGVSSNDTGSNRPLLQMNTESIAEVKVLTSGYQAEYGRSSGVQVSAVTKGGSNRFHGSLYDVDRNSKWNSNSKTNILNGNAKTRSTERDFGFSAGGPAGKPGGNNKLFFFYSQEFSPRTGGNNIQRFRMPTLLERQGDFSASTDNNGTLYNFIKDPSKSGACTAASQVACFADGGVLGRIPKSALYAQGMTILNMWPVPNITNVPAGQNYNYEITRPEENILSWQPAVRVDYQVTPALRATWRTSYWKQRSQTFNGSLPGFNDTRMQDKPVTNMSASVNYTVTPTMFLEATYGHAQNELAGCAQAQSSTGPIFCPAAVPVNPGSSLAGSGLQDLPFLFPDATVLNPGYYAVQALNAIGTPFWDGTRMSKVPTFAWGSRVTNTPPGIGFPGWLNFNSTNDFSVSLTKLQGRHTVKGGFYNTHSFKAEQTSNNAFGTINFQQDAVGTNQFDTSFGFSNAAIGAFSSYLQASKYAETSSIYNNTEFYLQDNWKVNGRLTLDYGMRFVHQQAQYDTFGQASNFVFNKWSTASAPAIYVPGCVGNTVTCSGTNRQAKNPLTGVLLGVNTTSAIGTLVPNSGDILNGLIVPGQSGVPRATFLAPYLGYAPRFGAAYDLTGNQSIVLRGGAGLFFDRPSSSTFSGGVNNPPTSAAVTVQFSQLQTLGKAGLTTQGVPALNAFQYDSRLPSSTQWNAGVQMALPGAIALDVSYVGQHAYDQYVGTNINAVDFGAAFVNIDQTTAGGTTPQVTQLLRPIKGYNGITLQENFGWRTYHSIQMSLNRRFRNGLSFGFNDTVSLYDHQQAGRRLQHNADGSYSDRADYAQAQDLFGDNHPQTHFMRANFVWDMPDIKSDKTVLRAIGLLVNDWQLSGIWSGSTATQYAVGFSYQNGIGNVNLTGSGDYGARVRIVGDTGRGCTTDVLNQFNTGAFAGPLVGSVGLESPGAYLHSCFSTVLDLAIARNIRLGGGRNVQLRLDMFNAPNSSTITGRNSTVNLTSPTGDSTTVLNPVYDATGALVRGTPANSGFGLATGFQTERKMQLQVRFQF